MLSHSIQGEKEKNFPVIAAQVKVIFSNRHKRNHVPRFLTHIRSIRTLSLAAITGTKEAFTSTHHPTGRKLISIGKRENFIFKLFIVAVKSKIS